jgi:hypothetical protein
MAAVYWYMGLSFNNFSARNLLNKEAYKPLPMGDGQKYLYDYKRVHFSDLQRFVFRTVVWTKKPVNSVLRYRTVNSF